MDDAVDQYLAASQVNDIDGLVHTLAPDAELVSPLSGRMVFRGREDVRAVLTVIYGSLNHVRWKHKISDSKMHVITGEAQIGPLLLEDAMAIELDSTGHIHRIKPHLRPWLAITLLAIKVAPQICRHPRVIRRALRTRQVPASTDPT
jgi:hypothetical protein